MQTSTAIKNRDMSIWHVYYRTVQQPVTDNNNFNVYGSRSYHEMARHGRLIEEVAELVTAAHSGGRSI